MLLSQNAQKQICCLRCRPPQFVLPPWAAPARAAAESHISGPEIVFWLFPPTQTQPILCSWSFVVICGEFRGFAVCNAIALEGGRTALCMTFTGFSPDPCPRPDGLSQGKTSDRSHCNGCMRTLFPPTCPTSHDRVFGSYRESLVVVTCAHCSLRQSVAGGCCC